MSAPEKNYLIPVSFLFKSNDTKKNENMQQEKNEVNIAGRF